MIPRPSTSAPRVAARKPGARNSARSTIGSATRASIDDVRRQRDQRRPTNSSTVVVESPDLDSVSPLTSRVSATASVTTPARSRRRGCTDLRLGQHPRARHDESQGDQPDDDVGLAPAGADVEPGREHRTRADPEADAGTPDARGVCPFRRLGEGVRQDGQPAGEHRRAADSLEHARGHEDRAVRRDAHSRANPGPAGAARRHRYAVDPPRRRSRPSPAALRRGRRSSSSASRLARPTPRRGRGRSAAPSPSASRR